MQEKQKQDPKVEKSLTHKNFVVRVLLFFLNKHSVSTFSFG